MADPVAQTFMIDEQNYPNGCFLKSIKLFFKSKSATWKGPVSLSIVNTLNGYPAGDTLNYSVTSVKTDDIKVSDTPHYLDSTTWTDFPFNAPVYVQSGVLYAIIIRAQTNEYEVWGVSLGDNAIASSVKVLPTDPTPSEVTKISTVPNVGSLFLSQNGLTWDPDLNSCLMFTMERCVFSKTTSPNIQFVVPKKLPELTLVGQAVDYFANSNTIVGSINSVSNNKIYVDAFNVSTTDFIPTGGTVNYTYETTLTDGTITSALPVTPGKYATPMSSDILLSDGLGKRILDPNTHTSFSVYAQLSTADDAVSPMISDSGLSVYALRNLVTDCELSNASITLVSGGSGYNANTTSVTISAPTGTGGVQATAVANVVGGVIDTIYLTNFGSGYIETPTLTITDANTTPGTGASAIVSGETSARGGNGFAKYITRKVTLNAGYESGDLNVYLTAYRPVGTDIHVYYKIQNTIDNQVFDDGVWQLMTMINNSSTLYSANRNEIYEYSFAPGTNGVDQGYITYTSTSGQTYSSFNQFAIKVVLRTSDSTLIPFVKDFRAIALPSNVDTAF